MKDHDVIQLHALRQLREQRASQALASQRQRCRESHAELDDARERLRLHRENLAAQAEQLYGRFSEGLSVRQWQNAQETLNDLQDDQEALQGDVASAREEHRQREQLREALSLTQRQRQRQADSWETVVDLHGEAHRRRVEGLEDGDDLLRPLAGLQP